MKDFVITRLPTLVNVEGMKLKELREAYKTLEGDAISQGVQLSETCAKLHQMNSMALRMDALLNKLVDHYEAGNQAAILLELKNMAAHRASKKAKAH